MEEDSTSVSDYCIIGGGSDNPQGGVLMIYKELLRFLRILEVQGDIIKSCNQ